MTTRFNRSLLLIGILEILFGLYVVSTIIWKSVSDPTLGHGIGAIPRLSALVIGAAAIYFGFVVLRRALPKSGTGHRG